MEVSDLVDALSGSFFALLGIWAAVGQRHWFLRVAVVATILLGSLMLPAYEVVIEFGLAMALISAGVWVAHGRKSWQFRFSMQTILLAMVVAAVGCAVFASAPEFSPRKWFWLIGVGIFVASIALTCLWIVYGKNMGWRLRVPVGLIVLAAVLGVSYALRGVSRVLTGSNWEEILAQYSTWEYFQRRLEEGIFSTSLAFLIIVAVLLLARGSRWFEMPASEAQTSPGRWTIVCRAGLTALMLTISLPLCYIGYRLMTPMPFPEVVMPVPNGYDDIVAASLIVPDDIQAMAQRAKKMNAKQLADELAKLEPARYKIREAFDKEVRVPRLSPSEKNDPTEESELWRSLMVLRIEADYAIHTGNIDQYLEISLQSSRIWSAVNDGLAWGGYWSVRDSSIFSTSQLHLLSAEQCKKFSRQLWGINSSRMTLEQRVHLLNCHYENEEWNSHINHLFRQWSGKDPHRVFRQNYSRSNAALQLFFAQLALQAYWLEHEKLPSSLTELVPDYFPTELQDPFGKELLHYQVEGSHYFVYSVGPDGEPGQHRVVDRLLAAPNARTGDDLVVFGPAQTPAEGKAAQ